MWQEQLQGSTPFFRIGVDPCTVALSGCQGAGRLSKPEHLSPHSPTTFLSLVSLMDEISKSYSISQEEQENAPKARQILRQRPLSREGPTYIDLRVELDGHWAAVLIVITPCPHPRFRRQLIFTPQCRYTLCCQPGPGSTEETSTRIGQAIQDVIRAYFPLEWDFLDQEW